MFENRRILVTGATGFIGQALALRLVAGGAEVVTLGRRGSLVEGAQDATLDRGRPEDIRAALGSRRFDAVFHLAAAGVAPGDRDAGRLFDVNVGLGRALLEATESKAYVFAGSSAEYARKDRAALTESDPLQFEDPYGASKAAGGLTHCAFAWALRKPLAVLRLFHVYGPGEHPHRLTSAILGSLSRGERAPLTEGFQVRDFLYLQDALEAFIMAGQSLMAGELATGPYNVSTGIGCPVRDACDAMARLIGAPPELLGFGEIPMRANELAFVVGDSSKFQSATGWRPRHGLEEGLRELLATVRQDKVVA